MERSNKRGKNSLKLLDFLKSFDAFGTRAVLNIGGKDSHNTIFGLVMTLMIYALLVAFGFKKFTNLYKKEDTTYHDTLIENKFQMQHGISFEDVEFNFMFGLLLGNQILKEHEYTGYLKWEVQLLT